MDLPVLCHWPSHPPPVELDLYTSAPHPCPYLAGRECITRAFLTRRIPGALYHQFMDAAFRRSGIYIYQPVCSGCRACIPIRVPVSRFAPSKSQRRCWRRNQDLRITAGVPEPTREKHRLYEHYRRHWHGQEESPDWDAFVGFLYDSPVETIEVCYREPSGALLGVGLCDVCNSSLSTLYFYFDPDHAWRGLGTFSAMWEIDLARRLGIAHYYMGYWVRGCGTMEYKASFRPAELLGPDGVWRGEGEEDTRGQGDKGTRRRTKDEG